MIEDYKVMMMMMPYLYSINIHCSMDSVEVLLLLLVTSW